MDNCCMSSILPQYRGHVLLGLFRVVSNLCYTLNNAIMDKYNF